MSDQNYCEMLVLPCQITLMFDAPQLAAMSTEERRTVVTTLATLLIEASQRTKGAGDDER